MNKLILIQIIKEIIPMCLKNELNTDSFNNIINNTGSIALTDEAVSYGESEIISLLFKNIPYYQIMTFLNKLVSTLNKICITPKEKCIKDLIEAYLSDLLPSIYARTTTEVNVHIQELLTLFYQRGVLEYTDTIKRLTRNIINPNLLASLDTAEQINYTQSILPNFIVKEEPLRETISRANFNKKNSIERSTQKTLTNYYTEQSYQELVSSIINVLDKYSLQDKEDSETLKDELFAQLGTLHLKAKKKWEETKPIDENQLTLKF